MARKKGFKKGVNQDDSRRRRTETTIQIRKEKKDDQIQKRRGVSITLCKCNKARTIYFCNMSDPQIGRLTHPFPCKLGNNCPVPHQNSNYIHSYLSLMSTHELNSDDWHDLSFTITIQSLRLFFTIFIFFFFNKHSRLPIISKTAVSDGHGGEFSSVFNIPNSPTGGDSFLTVATPEQISGEII